MTMSEKNRTADLEACADRFMLEYGAEKAQLEKLKLRLAGK